MSKTLLKISTDWRLFLLIVAALVAVSIYQFKTSPTELPKFQEPLALEKEEGNVNVAVEKLKDEQENKLEFNITLDTHSVDLDVFDFQNDVSIEKNGQIILPIKAELEGGGHHRRAKVVFDKQEKPFILVLTGLSAIDRREFSFPNQ